ncbi:MAG: dephospho-CoA kinase [Magnetovibrio sp.]|nr:dephospho-CoA kinase [Magnetovibrio sp.]
MFVLGLTGSIGMGKTWGAHCFRLFGVPVHDADACVHRLMAVGGRASQQVERLFPKVLKSDGGVDRQKLAGYVLGDDAALIRLENLLHPLVHQDQRQFLQVCQRRRMAMVVLDIPLLYETNAHTRVDAVVVMSASRQIQRQRVLHRPGMNAHKFEAIAQRQIENTIKCRLADHIVTTGTTRGQSLRQIAKIVKVCKHQKGHVWGPHWGH